VILLGIVLLGGCDSFKGDKGDSGTAAVISSKHYTGSPYNNPFKVIVDSIDLSKQVIEVYRCNDATYTTKIKQLLPFTVSGVESHIYSIENDNMVTLFTSFVSTMPQYALTGADGTRYYYDIYIKTFASAQAKKSYLDKGNNLNTLIYGK
jgi:hypothetical protein